MNAEKIFEKHWKIYSFNIFEIKINNFFFFLENRGGKIKHSVPLLRSSCRFHSCIIINFWIFYLLTFDIFSLSDSNFLWRYWNGLGIILNFSLYPKIFSSNPNFCTIIFEPKKSTRYLKEGLPNFFQFEMHTSNCRIKFFMKITVKPSSIKIE